MMEPKSDSKNKLCGNCDYNVTNDHCSLTGLQAQLYQTCKLHKPVQGSKPVIRKVVTVGFFITLLMAALKLWLITEREEDTKTGTDMLNWAYEQQIKSNSEIQLLYYIQDADTLNMKKFTGVFHTDDFNYSTQLFREQLPKHFDHIPFSGKGNKKIFIKNRLFTGFIDSNKVLISEICGQIEYVGRYKYFYETEK